MPTVLRLNLFLLPALLVACLGCDSTPSPVPVTITLQHKGKPVSEVRVNLLGAEGKSAFAFTDTAGKTEGFKTAGKDGVVPGEYTVTIAPKEETPLGDSETADYSAAPEKVSFPARYKTISGSDQTVTVQSDGENNFTVELND